MDAIKLLRSQGFGSRNVAKYLIENDLVFINDELVTDCKKIFQNPWGLRLKVDDETLITRQYVYLALHKPADYETSHRPQHHRSVFDLLPPRLIERGVQAVGRLDADTTGLLLFSDDGQFIHKVSSGKRKCVKKYRVGLRHPATERFLQALLDGVLLHDDNETVRALSAYTPSPTEEGTTDAGTTLMMEIDSGKYHQVKRMVAAAGNRVDTLHRVSIGSFTLPAELQVGQWKELSEQEVLDCQTL